MAIDNTDTIDGMAYDEESQAVVLLLTDHLSWKHTKETNILKESDHLVLLQDKINAYISFLENGQYVKPQIISGDFRRLFQAETPVTVCG